jgi:ELWxxDGT repeat protein
VLFASRNAGGAPNLGVTDGTSAGTTELIVAGANSGGLFGANLPPDFTVLGSVALFEGYDTAGNVGLWVTDGTSAGTRELTPSVPLGLDGHPDFTVFGTKALFIGNGHLWVTDGTSAGTSELSAATSFSPLYPSDITVLATTSPPTPYDFNGDGKSDLLFRNSSGEADIWELNGTSVLVAGSIGNPGPSWHERATGDFNGDGYADILWQNADGSVAIWEMHGTSMIGGAIVANPGPSWHAVGTGDFNHDGDADILWQSSDGSVAVWEMSGTSPIASNSPANARSPPASPPRAMSSGLLKADRRHPFLDAHAEDGLGEHGNLRGPAYYN